MPSLGELLLVLLVVLAVFSFGRLPAAGDALGAALRGLFRSGNRSDHGGSDSSSTSS